jgi:uncharacterized protein YciI
MLYIILGEDAPNSIEKRLATRPAHQERLKLLEAAGRIVLGGPLPAIDSVEPGQAGYTGTLIVAEFPSLAQAQAWAQADPYVTAGVFSSVLVRPFRKVYPP